MDPLDRVPRWEGWDQEGALPRNGPQRRGGFTGDFGALCGNRPPEDPSWCRASPPAVMLTLRFDQNFGDSQTLPEGHINQGNGSVRFLAATPGPKPLPPPKVFSPRIPSPLPADSPPLASQGLRSRSPVGSPEQPSPACQPPQLALQRPPHSPRLPLHCSARTSAPACSPGSHCSLLGAKSIGSVTTLPSTSHWLSWGRDLSAELSHPLCQRLFSKYCLYNGGIVSPPPDRQRLGRGTVSSDWCLGQVDTHTCPVWQGLSSSHFIDDGRASPMWQGPVQSTLASNAWDTLDHDAVASKWM